MVTLAMSNSSLLFIYSETWRNLSFRIASGLEDVSTSPVPCTDGRAFLS